MVNGITYLAANAPLPGWIRPSLCVLGPYPNEFEHEKFIAKKHRGTPGTPPLAYTITRRPVPSQGARETALPTGVVIDLTTWNTNSPERSVLPVDLNTLYVDIMIASNGTVIAMDANANAAPQVMPAVLPLLVDRHRRRGRSALGADERFRQHRPACRGAQSQSERHDSPSIISSPCPPSRHRTRRRGGGSAMYSLPQTLKGDRRLLSINTRTGAITSTLIETFYVDNTQYPYEAAERGIKDVQP